MTPWQSTVRSATPGALREVGDRCFRAAEHAEDRGAGHPPWLFRRVFRALQVGDPDRAVRALTRVAPEFRAPILYALDVEASLERRAS